MSQIVGHFSLFIWLPAETLQLLLVTILAARFCHFWRVTKFYHNTPILSNSTKNTKNGVLQFLYTFYWAFPQGEISWHISENLRLEKLLFSYILHAHLWLVFFIMQICGKMFGDVIWEIKEEVLRSLDFEQKRPSWTRINEVVLPWKKKYARIFVAYFYVIKLQFLQYLCFDFSWRLQFLTNRN